MDCPSNFVNLTEFVQNFSKSKLKETNNSVWGSLRCEMYLGNLISISIWLLEWRVMNYVLRGNRTIISNIVVKGLKDIEKKQEIYNRQMDILSCPRASCVSNSLGTF